MSCVYLLRIVPAYKHARHYIGFCEDDDPTVRIERHKKGRGARLMEVAVTAGCRIKLIHVWPGARRNFERRLKARRDVTHWCPCCRNHTKPMPQVNNGKHRTKSRPANGGRVEMTASPQEGGT